MIKTAIVFLVLAIIAAILGFRGIHGQLVGISRVAFFLLLVFALVSLLLRKTSHSS